MAKTGLTNEQYAEIERIKKKKKKRNSPTQIGKDLKTLKKKKNADAAI